MTARRKRYRVVRYATPGGLTENFFETDFLWMAKVAYSLCPVNTGVTKSILRLVNSGGITWEVIQ